MMNNYNEDVLAHVGVLGMRWGHKKGEGWNSSKSRQHVAKVGKQRIATTGKKLNKPGTIIKKKKAKPFTTPTDMPPKRITDAQLKARINRIEMEKKYALLTKKETSRGKKFAIDVLEGAGKKVATEFTAKAMTGLLERMVTKAADK